MIEQVVHPRKEFKLLFMHLVFQVFLVGLTIGSMRTVLPTISESQYGVVQGSLFTLTTFVIAFGVIKALFNVIAGSLSDRVGRKNVLLMGWLTAVPIPFLLWYGESFSAVIWATVFLGMNQGLAWSMTQSAKMDIVNSSQRGHAMGLNECFGYCGVAISGIITGYMAEYYEPAWALFIFISLVVLTGFLSTYFYIDETKDQTGHSSEVSVQMRADSHLQPAAQSEKYAFLSIFTLVSWKDFRMMSICQAGMVEKFVDALVWVYYPVYFYHQGLSLSQIGWLVSGYGISWGLLQLVTGKLSDRIGRSLPIVWGMTICGLSVFMMLMGSGFLWWTLCSVLTGVGMALLYPNLSAAIVDSSLPEWRSSAIGIYRFWRDIGYSVGALVFGSAAHFYGSIEIAFSAVAVAMILSALLVAKAYARKVPLTTL